MAVLQDININVFAQPSEKRLRTFLVLSQNENGRVINFRILGPPLPSNCTATFTGTKPDGNVYSTAGTVTGNFVIVQEDMQMTAVAGVWDAKLDIINGTHNIMTALIRVIVEPDVVNPDAIASDSQLQGLVAECKYYAEQARQTAYGSPLTASTRAAMTDQTRVYVYTGSETGMVAGNWYYYNGSAWTSGGVYNAVAVQTDRTLTAEDKAADAKATGQAIAAVNAHLNTIPLTYTRGAYIKNNGETVDIANPTTSANYEYLVDQCSAGDVYNISGSSQSGARAYAFADSSYNVLTYGITGTYECVNVIAPANAAYFISNSKWSEKEGVCFKGQAWKDVNPIPLDDGTDLNNVLKTGTYCVRSAASSNTILHLPSDYVSSGFWLRVFGIRNDYSEARTNPYIMQVLSRNSSDSVRIYYRVITTSGTISEWYKVQRADDTLDVNQLKAIPSNSDLDDYTVSGTYYSPDTATTKTIANAPTLESGFSLWVFKSAAASSAHVRHIAFPNKRGTTTIYTRCKTSAGWGGWERMLTTNEYFSPKIAVPVVEALPARSGTPKKTIRVATNNVAHYWMQGFTPRRYTADYPIMLMNWRKYLINAGIDIFFLQECEEWIDSAHEMTAFDYLYKSFFDSNTNVNTSGQELNTGNSPYARKVLNRLGMNTETALGTIDSLYDANPKDGYYNWCISSLTGVGNILLINVHNFASGVSNELHPITDRANYLGKLKDFIDSKNGQFDYFIIAGDFNSSNMDGKSNGSYVISPTNEDFTNIKNFCTSVGGSPVNGGLIGWYPTRMEEDQMYCLDNIIVSNNIRIDRIECESALLKQINTDHIPVVAEVSFM